MYFIYYKGWQSIAAGICIGFSIPIIISIYTEKIVKRYLIKGNLLLLLTINTIVNVLVIFFTAALFVVLFYFKGDFLRLFKNLDFLLSNYFTIGVGFGLILALFFNFFFILNTLIGPKVLAKLFFGMYRKPVEVDRVFMFLDIKSSTSIAEKMGHLKFLSLVNDFFYDITDPVKQTKGEIYKYVGDEAIITWKTKDAIDKSNCIRCYSMIESVIKEKSEYYMGKYGIVPEFKAGVHGGISVTGELGYTKREIAFMGDVLNTTARIEGACKTYNEPLLISEDIISQLKQQNFYQFSEVGKAQLRGKQEEMVLYKIQQ